MPVTTPERDTERDLIEVPLYSPHDAARYLGVPVRAVADLFGYATPSEESRLSFGQLADAFVLSAAWRALCVRGACTTEGEQAVRKWWRERAAKPVFVSGVPPEERAVDLIGSPAGVPACNGHELKAWLMRHFDRVVIDDGVPVRLFPFSRRPAENSPRVIVLDPAVRFGRPTISNRGLPTDIIFERFQAGDSVRELANDYGMTDEEVEEALRYESLSRVDFSEGR